MAHLDGGIHAAGAYSVRRRAVAEISPDIAEAVLNAEHRIRGGGKNSFCVFVNGVKHKGGVYKIIKNLAEYKNRRRKKYKCDTQ